ncbi:MAG: galactose mutarotase [Oscillospiraceae bacterium]|jgi:aldose 1-epimerase|nr:galactose mutarotase [Oscillospiraceae bacterium]
MVKTASFGSLDGKDLPLLTLSAGDLEVELIPYGAAIRSIRFPDRDGKRLDLCLGYDTPQEYAIQDACLGGTIGRYANRIAGASLPLGEKVWPLASNEGKNTLHGGTEGFHKKWWDYAPGEDSVTFSLTSPHGDEGFPGTLKVEVTYALTPDSLTISYEALSDADTVASLTNHAYFNLSGQDSGTVDGHILTLHAREYTPSGKDNLPTGEILPVAGTPFDLTQPTLLSGQVFDHNFVLNTPAETPFALLHSPASGVAVEFSTNLPGVQLYTADFLTPRPGKGGALYGPRQGLCLEPQFYPDAPHHPHFPSPLLRAGDVYRRRISFRFLHL